MSVPAGKRDSAIAEPLQPANAAVPPIKKVLSQEDTEDG